MIEMAVHGTGGCETNVIKHLLNELVAFLSVPFSGAVGSNMMNFRLSRPKKGSCVKRPENNCERLLDTSFYKDDISFSICNHEPIDFGLCHHQVGHFNDLLYKLIRLLYKVCFAMLQDGGDFVNKYYIGGLKFLLVLDDGSAQVLYPNDTMFKMSLTNHLQVFRSLTLYSTAILQGNWLSSSQSAVTGESVLFMMMPQVSQ